MSDINVFEITNKVLTGHLNFKGELTNDHESGTIGDIRIAPKDSSLYVLNKSGWELLCESNPVSDTGYNEKVTTPHHCPSCGAVLKQHQNICDYCRTEFW